jgi:hypothetical protein
MEIQGSQVFRSGRSRPTYGRVQASVSARLSEDGEELLIESSIPVSKGFSDVCFVLPVDALPELVRLGLSKGAAQNSES